VGASGAGKSSLVSLLLGWLGAAEGTIEVDGAPLDGDAVARLRLQTAWIDPAIHIWNRTLYENVSFGSEADGGAGVPQAMARADLTEVLANLPEGLQANLGEGGARVSGGQGQRVRLARALMRTDARLVILDEPFRGLERERRRELLARVRAHWVGATLLFVSHDVRDTLDFERVLVVADGTIVEDGPARSLLADPASRFRALARADEDLYDRVWTGSGWIRYRMDHGTLVRAEGT
jgi:ATP-binding cassette subfamily B protein